MVQYFDVRFLYFAVWWLVSIVCSTLIIYTRIVEYYYSDLSKTRLNCIVITHYTCKNIQKEVQTTLFVSQLQKKRHHNQDINSQTTDVLTLLYKY